NSSISGTSNAVTVNPGNATHLILSAPPSATAGKTFSVTVRALDAYNNTATGYTGTVHFTKSDGGSGSGVPADYTFLASEGGVHSFSNGVILVSTPSQTVSATDTSNSSITGTSNAVTVKAASATHLMVGAPSTATVGV